MPQRQDRILIAHTVATTDEVEVEVRGLVVLCGQSL